MFRGRRRKSSQTKDDSLPTSVKVTTSEDQAGGGDEWDDWGHTEEFSVKVEPASTAMQEQSPANDDLFRDMTPVFQKTKKIVVKKKRVYSDENDTLQTESSSSRLKFDVSYPPVAPELGTWAEESTVWDEEGVSEKDIDLETEKLKKERKQAERERRAMEQQKKREEREAQKVEHKKPHGHFGVRIST